MSKKKISQIVGLTIGTAAIASIGVASSVALSSCTSEFSSTQTAPVQVKLSNNNMLDVFKSIKSSLSGYQFDQATPEDLNSVVLNTVIKSGIANALAKTNLKASDIVSLVLTPIPTESSITPGLYDSVSIKAEIKFADNVVLPRPSSNASYSVNGQTATNAKVITLNNHSVVNLTNNSAKPIYESVQKTIYNYANDETRADPSFLNSPDFKNLVVNNIIRALVGPNGDKSNILSSNIESVSFKVDPPKVNNQNVTNPDTLDLNFDIKFNNDVQLKSWKNVYFSVNGQTITSTKSISIKNPHHIEYVIDSIGSQGIFQAVQSCVVSSVSSDSSNLNLEYLNNDIDFQNQLKEAIINSGADLDSSAIGQIEFSNLSGTQSSSAQASLGFTINFGGNVTFKNFDKSSLFDANDYSHSLSTKYGVNLVVANPNYQKAQLNPNNASNLYNRIMDKVQAKIKSFGSNPWSDADLNSDSFINNTIKPTIISAAGQSRLKPEDISSVVFTSDVNPTNHAFVNIGVTISFNPQTISLSNWTNSNPYFSVNMNNNCLGTKQGLQVKNPNFQPIQIHASDAASIYSAVQATINQKINSLGVNRWTQADLNTPAFKAEVIASFMQAANVSNYQPIDVANFILTVSPIANDDSQVNINYNLSFGDNVVLDGFSSHDPSAYYQEVNHQTLYSKSFAVANPQTPARPVLNSNCVDKINDLVTQGLKGLSSQELVNHLNDNSIFINGLKSSIADTLTNSYGVVNFSASNIVKLSFDVQGPDANTNMITVLPSIQFNDKVMLQGVSVQAHNTINLNPYVVQASGPFLSLTNVNSNINKIIDTKLNNLATQSPNLLNNDYLNSNQLINSLSNQIVNACTGSNLSTSDFDLSFQASINPNQCQVDVSYQIVFHNQVKFAANITSSNVTSLTVDVSTKTFRNKNSLSYGYYVLDAKKVKNIYDTISNQIASYSVQDILNGLLNRPNVINSLNIALNQSLGLSNNVNVLKSLSFDNDKDHNQVIAHVTLNDQFSCSSSVNSDHISLVPNTTNQLDMSYAVANLDSYVTDGDLILLNQTVNAWIQQPGRMDQIATNTLNDNLGGLYHQLDQAGFNLNLIDQDPSQTQFKISFGNDNQVSLDVKFQANVVDSAISSSNPNYDHATKTYHMVCKTSQPSSQVLTQARFDAIQTITNQKVQAVYQTWKSKGDVRGLADALNATTTQNGKTVHVLSDAIWQEVQTSTGLNTQADNTGLGLISFKVDNDYGMDQVSISYQFSVCTADNSQAPKTTYFIPATLNTNGFSVTSQSQNGVSENIYTHTLAPQASIQTHKVNNYVLNNLAQWIKDTYQPLYAQTNSTNKADRPIIDSNFLPNHLDTIKTKFGQAIGLDPSQFQMVISNAPTYYNNGWIDISIQLDPRNTIFENIHDGNPFFSVNPGTGYIGTNQPFQCGSGLYNFKDNTLTSLTPWGKQAGQLVLSSYQTLNDISTGAMYDCAASLLDFSDVHFKNNQMPAIITDKYSGVFHNNNLQRVVLPKDITSLPAYLFSSCHFLNRIDNLWDNSKITAYPQGFLSNCTSINNTIRIPSWVKTIGQGAFDGCGGITGLDLSQLSLSDMSENSIANIVNGTSNIQSLVLPPNFNFSQCVIDGPLYNALSQIDNDFDLTLPNSCSISPEFFEIKGDIRFGQGIRVRTLRGQTISAIGANAFANNSSLQKFICNQSSSLTQNTTIPAGAFYNCVNMTTNTLLSNDSNVTSFGEDCFNGCINLVNVWFNNAKARSFASGCFANCILVLNDSLGQLHLGNYYDSPSYGPGSMNENYLNRLDVDAFAHTRILNSHYQDINYNIVNVSFFSGADPSTVNYTIYGNGVLFSSADANNAMLRQFADNGWEWVHQHYPDM